MRQGRVQPLSVTTALYGRPVLGTSGGIVSGLVWITGSGSAAIATLLTLVAAMAAPAPALPSRKLRRFAVMRLFRRSMAGRAGITLRGAGARARQGGRLADQRGLQGCVGQPEVALRVDGLDDARDLLARVGEELEH